jgi:hypothetical protein
MLTLLDFENAILDLFEKNRITIQDAKIVLWTLTNCDDLVQVEWHHQFHDEWYPR